MSDRKYNRVFVVVLDSLGVGALADAAEYGDVGADTLGHISQNVEKLHIPNLQKLGMANLHELKNIPAVANPLAYYTKLNEASTGKDTMTGHWEMMGLHITQPFKTFTDTGFPQELLDELSKRTGRTIIGNKSASGTEILDELAEEEIATGHMIVYTSADSVLQICGNEETFGLEELYRCCEIAREITMKDEWKVGRIIARPYIGKKKGEFKRTSNRHDYALKPYGRTALDALKDAGLEVISVGKIYDIFDSEGITESNKSKSSVHGMEQTIEIANRDFKGLCFVNLVDFDALWGHRRDVAGYAKEGGSITQIGNFGGDYAALSGGNLFDGFHRGNTTTYAFSGALEHSSFDEPGFGGANLVTLNQVGDGVRIETARVDFGARRYVMEQFDVTGAMGPSEVVEKITTTIKERGYGSETALKVILVGYTPIGFSIPKTITAETFGIYLLEIEDRTLPTFDESVVARDMTVRGEVCRTLIPKMRQGTEEERQGAAYAMRVALGALEGKDISQM